MVTEKYQKLLDSCNEDQYVRGGFHDPEAAAEIERLGLFGDERDQAYFAAYRPPAVVTRGEEEEFDPVVLPGRKPVKKKKKSKKKKVKPKPKPRAKPKPPSPAEIEDNEIYEAMVEADEVEDAKATKKAALLEQLKLLEDDQ